jgi:D-methionine transport system permease protein
MSGLFAHLGWGDIGAASLDTLIMLAGSLLATVVIGLPLGVILFLTGPKRLLAQPAAHAALSVVVNGLRSVPFIILLILMIARLVESALREVDPGVVEAAQSMGATDRQIVFEALLPEAMPGIVAAITVTAVALVSYTAMAGVVGAGGLGDLAIRFGYQRFQPDVMVVTVVLLLIIVQALQMLGDRVVLHVSHR